MKITVKSGGLTPGKRLDIRRNEDDWALWEGDTRLESVKVNDARLGLDHYKVIVSGDGRSAEVVLFADLHRHSDNSLLDGMTKVPDMVDATEYAGALTDHGNVYGFLEYYKAMKEAGKHPIIGFEAYQEDMEGRLERNHLILLAKNLTGYKNILKLTSESYQHVYRKPHVTWEMLEKYHEGVIATSACLGGVIPQAIQNGTWNDAVAAASRLRGIFGEDFYLEIQRHDIPEEDYVNPRLIALSEQLGIPLIATTDSHYLRAEDKEAHEVALCIQTKKTILEPHMSFNGTGYHIHTSAEMEQKFSDIPYALDNTLRLAEKCNVEVPLGNVNLPEYAIPEGFKTPLEYFRHLCETGFQKRFAGKPELTDQRYIDRFEYEYRVIRDMHFESYFIIVQDFINYARSQNIYIGPGRGSAAGSLLAYCMGITDMDPIRFNLLFERFLNPERVSWPDIDTDIAHTGRQDVIDYVTRKYGAECVCRIVTFGTMAPKMVIKDVARALQYPVGMANSLANMIPKDPKITLKKAFEMNPELRDRYESDADVKRIIDIARALEGNKRHASLHACGLVLSPGAVSNFLPTSMEQDEDTGEKSLASQVIMTEVEELSLLKMDLLGLKNLSAIHEVIETVKKTRGIDTIYQDLPLDDRETYRMLSKGITGGVFQLESAGMTNLITQMFSDINSLPDERMGECFERLIAAVALYRPGPMDYIPNYIAGMRDIQNVHYLTPELRDILGPSYGVTVYQEQVMQIVQKLAGYSLGRADLVRKAMSKKKQKVMDAEREVFIYGNKQAFEAGKDKSLAPGCIANGIPEDVAAQIWGQMADFAKYAFNRSHAACYAWLSSITAYMSAHWTPEFYCAMMNAFSEIGDKVKVYMSQAVRRGVKILPPDINKSSDKCIVEDGCIRLGFHALAYLNKLSSAIVKVREAGVPFEDYQDFYERISDAGHKPNKNALDSLIFSGAFDTFGLNRKQLSLMTGILEADYKKNAGNRALGQYSLFTGVLSRVPVPKAEEFTQNQLMEKEFKAVGFYLTRHPVDALYDAAAGKPKFHTVTDLSVMEEPLQGIFTYGIIRDLQRRYTKKGDEMYAFSVEDKFGTIRCVLFPKRVAANKHLLVEGTVIKIAANFSVDEEYGSQLIVEDLFSPDAGSSSSGIVVVINSKEEQTLLLDYLQAHPGDIRVSLRADKKDYKLRKGIAMTPETLDWLKSHFCRVTA